MKYFLKEFQSGGCDYTIRCGERLTEIKADTMEDAVREAVSRIVTEGERAVDSAVVLEVSATHSINIKSLKEDRRRAKKEAEAAAASAKERAEYERLKQKFQGA